MAMLLSRALTQELDTFTPCVQIPGSQKQEAILLRMHTLIQKILSASRDHFTTNQQEKVLEALRFSAKHHRGVYRKDGHTPYFMHLLEVVNIILEKKIFDFKIFVAAILHDTVEDTEVSLREVGKLFGSAVRNIVDLMTKHPNFIRKTLYWWSMRVEPDLNCRWRVIVIKFADRIHNLMTLDALPDWKKAEKLSETEREFPSLYKTLASTIMRLYKKGTIKNKSYLSLPFRLNNRLIYEMERYS